MVTQGNKELSEVNQLYINSVEARLELQKALSQVRDLISNRPLDPELFAKIANAYADGINDSLLKLDKLLPLADEVRQRQLMESFAKLVASFN